jgi:hypothetical protein
MSFFYFRDRDGVEVDIHRARRYSCAGVEMVRRKFPGDDRSANSRSQQPQAIHPSKIRSTIQNIASSAITIDPHRNATAR